ncbi:hypothetical protein GCM10010911_65970 [Paenibacillus nasutitermitis]|uniref:Uncharacterized protein n=2 Tax=Paenibacillus nasutitermitis TaxID=1652958 RepID=A0A916ZHC5_9BACL|nr:hypothetical protein GCM10010911_65970 [Paenibacillus nasutitermitis]
MDGLQGDRPLCPLCGAAMVPGGVLDLEAATDRKYKRFFLFLSAVSTVCLAALAIVFLFHLMLR